MKDGGDFYSKLGRLFPADRLLVDPAHLAAYESDGLTAFAVTPQAVVVVETADEVIETVRLCHAHGVPFVARGSGTSLSGGSLPNADGIVIALNRLNRILNLDPAERIAVVEPGVVNLHVSAAAAPYGLHFAPDPPASAASHTDSTPQRQGSRGFPRSGRALCRSTAGT